MKATNVKAIGNNKIEVAFDDGIHWVIDLAYLLQKGIFRALTNPTLFANVYTTGEAIAWSDELEIDALNIYSKIAKKDPSELARKYFAHAAD